MKKFLAMTVFTLGIVLMQFAQAAAQEVYATTETRNGQTSDTYVITESIQAATFDGMDGFKVRLHTIGKNFSLNKYWELGFYYVPVRRDWRVVWLPSSYSDPANKNATAYDVLQVCRRYI